MAKVAVNTGSIGETSYRADGLFGNQVAERDIIDLRNSSHKVQDYKRLLEREFNKAVAGTVRGSEGEWEIVQYHKDLVFSGTLLAGGDLPAETTATFVYFVNNSVNIQTFNHRDKDYVGFLIGNSGKWYKTVYQQSTDYEKVFIDSSYGDVRADFIAGTYTLITCKSTRKKSNTLLHCDIIGNPANYYRGQTYIDSGVKTTAIGDVVWAKTASGGGTAGNFYKALTVQSAIDLATQDYSNATNWTDLGSDWDGAGSWRTGVSGTPLVVGENGEDYTDSTVYPLLENVKLSKKSTKHLLTMCSNDGGVTWLNVTNDINSTTNKSTAINYNLKQDSRTYIVFYETHTNMAENAVNSEVLALGDVVGLIGDEVNRGGYLAQSLFNKVLINGNVGYAPYLPLNTYRINQSTKSLYDWSAQAPSHGIIELSAVTVPAVKTLPYITKKNGKAYLQLVFKEMKFDVDWGDDSKFNIVNNVSTTADDNGNRVLIGQKRIELPYFIEDKE